ICQMLVETTISQRNQTLVETSLVHPGLVGCDQHNGTPFRIERECRSPNAVIGDETRLLHIAMLRALQSVRVRAAQSGARLPQIDEVSSEFVLDAMRKHLILARKCGMEDDIPRHLSSYSL